LSGRAQRVNANTISIAITFFPGNVDKGMFFGEQRYT
jgi:hypothetical protein